MDEPDHIVLRPAPDLPDGSLPAGYDGRWIDRNQLQPYFGERPSNVFGMVCEPVGRFEVRDDGAVAEVWEVRAERV